MIFVDTGAWFASVVPSDSDYAAAVSWLSGNAEPLLTTDYVVDETLTLLKVRGEHSRALKLGAEFFSGALATVYYLTETDIAQTWETFQRFSDKDWSFTDCASKVIIEKLNLKYAFAFDRHFRQFGTVSVIP
jgi:predicted nucleic acid-binding protein